MCTHGRYIFNRYSRRKVFVKCGKCPSCLQEKAFARANRIRNNVTDGTLTLFITLTYSNDYVPYVSRSELLCSTGDICVYRNAEIRQVFNPHTLVSTFKKDAGTRPIAMVNSFDFDLSAIDKLRSLNGLSNDCIGVCWYPDIQLFYKRLRQLLIRNYNVTNKFSYFTCSEYGGYSQRPHFHALLFIKREDEASFRSAICEAWSYADKARTAKFIEIARDASNYVASYVNRSSCLSSLLSADVFKQKHSQSKNFGVVLDCFSLRSILQKIDHGDLFYYRQQKYDGQSAVLPVPIPLYVLHRHFPICKGFSWLSTSQLRTILLDPQRVGDILTDVDITVNYHRDIYDYDSYFRCLFNDGFIDSYITIHRQCKLDNPVYHYTPQETYRIYVRLENCYQRFHTETGLSRYDYMHYYLAVYPLYMSMVLKLSHQDIQSIDDYSDFYENALEVFEGVIDSPTLSNLNLQIDPNKRCDIVSKSNKFTQLFYKMDKQRKVVNYAMSNLGYYV